MDMESHATTSSSSSSIQPDYADDARVFMHLGGESGKSEAASLVDGIDRQNSEDPRGLLSWGSFRDKQTSGGMNLALYEDPGIPLVSSYIRAYTTPGPAERAQSKKKKANLGVMLGVYLPTIQHILGVTMFIRLFWLVGIAGIGQTFLLLFVCCLCTFLTCISLSAVATNGVVESGGPYFMISRNLGPEFGSAVGILFYLANTVAASMYLVGGIEILLLYIFPEMTIGGHEAHQDTGLMGMMSHNLRIYATVLLIIEFIIVAMGVRFVQLLAPVSLICVIVSILACYAGGIEKTLHPNAGQSVCMLGDRLLQAKVVLPEDADLADICNYCHHNSTSSVIYENFCPNNTCSEEWLTHEMRCINAFPGFGSNALFENLGSNYLKLGEAAYGQQADRKTEVFQDVTTTFFLLMAIYFPAVTGIFTGTNMSGDLANPQSSIPAGTIAAQLTTSFVYFSLALCFGAAIDGNVLRDKYGQSLHGGMVVAYLSWPSPWVLLIGSFLSTFGAALQCLCSAPRLLQSIARDDVIPMLSPFAKVTKNNEPFYGLIITTIIAEMAILMGAVDQIAAVVDFFFLMCYAFVNLICVLHSLLGAPNWRPRFRYYHWSLSLLGASLCFFIMFTTHWDYAIISVVLCLAIYKYVEWKGAKKEWGDGIRGLALSTAQYSIQKIEEKDPHPKNWRPQLLLLFTMPWSKDIVDVRYLNLLNLAGQMKAGKGLTMVVAFVRGNPTSIEDRQKAEKVKERMLFDMGQTRLRGFAKTLVYGETQITGSVSTLIQSVGIGGLRPNTLLLSWPTHDRDSGHEAVDSEYQTFLDKLHAGATMDMCLLVAKGITEFPVSSFRLNGKIDIYWIVQDGGLLILIAYLLKQNKVWRHCKLRVIAIAQEMDNSMKLKSDLEQYVYQLRIDAKVTVVELTDPEISKNAFERTLLMEEGKQMVQKMQVQQQRSKAESPLVTAERKLKEQQERRLDSKSDSSLDELDDSPTSPRRSDGSGSPKVDIRKEMPVIFPKVPESKNNTNAKSPSAERNKKFRELDRQKVHKMHTAVRLNEVITEHSQDSQLILLNLPKPPQREGLDDYIHYLEVLSKDIKRVIFVRGAGKEVITTNS